MFAHILYITFLDICVYMSFTFGKRYLANPMSTQRRHDIQHDDTQNDNIQHNGITRDPEHK